MANKRDDRISVTSSTNGSGRLAMDNVSADRLSISSSATDDGVQRQAVNVSVEPRFFVDFEGDTDEFQAPVKASSRLTYTALDICRLIFVSITVLVFVRSQAHTRMRAFKLLTNIDKPFLFGLQ